MGGSGSRTADETGRASGTADLTASVLLLGVALVLGLVGARAIWSEAGALTDSSRPLVPGMCAFEQMVVVAGTVLSLAIFVCATITVARRRRRHLTASPAAAIAVGGVALVALSQAGSHTWVLQRCAIRDSDQLRNGTGHRAGFGPLALPSPAVPETIAIGGGVSRAGEVFWRPLREGLAVGLSRDNLPVPALVHAELVDDAGLHGAAIEARERLARSSVSRPRAFGSSTPRIGPV